jgi:hypothetical protein
MIYLVTWVFLIDLHGSVDENRPPINEIVLPDGTPHHTESHAAKVVVDLMIHKYMWNTPGVDNAISVVPIECLAHMTNKDIWDVLTHFRAVNIQRITYKVARRMYGAGDCYLHKSYWKWWSPYLLDHSH